VSALLIVALLTALVTGISPRVYADTFGNTSISGMFPYPFSSGYVLFAYFVAPSSGSLSSISFYAANPSGNGNAGIYSDSSGMPGSLLAQGTPGALSNGWNTFTTASISITASTTYWLGFQMQGGSFYYSTVASSSSRAWIAAVTCCDMPSSVSSLTGSGSGSYAIYASVGVPSSYSFNVKSGATQIVVTLTYGWTGSGAPPAGSITIVGPGGTPQYQESAGAVYDRTTIAVSGSSNTYALLHRVTFTVSGITSPQVWTALISLASVSTYNITIEVS